MKQILYRFFIIGLFIFSFYYTNKVVEFLREKDPLMQMIKGKENKYTTHPINGEIIGKEMIIGQKGKEIDYEESYQKMKKYGAYNDSLMVLKETTPEISLKNNYDKYIIRGNKQKKYISLLFIIKEDYKIEPILKILNQKKETGTFFIDGVYLERNISLIKRNNNHEFEIRSYHNSYQSSLMKTAISYLETITNQKEHFCYTEEENEELLKLCMSLKIHTIKPTIILKKNIYSTIKKELSNSMMISIEGNKEIEKELSITLDYIKEKGYKIVSLKELLKE